MFEHLTESEERMLSGSGWDAIYVGDLKDGDEIVVKMRRGDERYKFQNEPKLVFMTVSRLKGHAISDGSGWIVSWIGLIDDGGSVPTQSHFTYNASWEHVWRLERIPERVGGDNADR